jgi:hypothetical protein
MRRSNVLRPGLAGGVATALTAGSVGLFVAGAAPAGAAGAPTCGNTGLVSDTVNPINNHDGTSSLVLVGSSDTATATITIPAGVHSAQLDICGAQGTSTATTTAPVDGGMGGRTTATITVTGGNTLLLLAGGTASGGAPGPGGGAGGGFSAVYLGSTANRATAIAYAGGGGGAGGTGDATPADPPGGAGGAGGGQQAADGQFGSGAMSGTPPNAPGTGASETTPGHGGASSLAGASGSDGAADTGGAGGVGAGSANGGGGGGAGWYGGGGGAGGQSSIDPGSMSLEYDGGGGGGGGSGHVTSVAAARNSSMANGVRTGAGAVVLTYNNPSPPVFGPGFTDTVQVGAAYTRTITVSAVDTATITIDSGTMPHGVTFQDNGNNSATLSGTPDVPGHYPFTLRASNGAPPDATQSYAIDVVTAGATAPPSPTASASGTPSASQSASPSSTASSSVGPGGLTLRTTTPDIQPNQQGILDVTGAGNAVIELRCYSRPSTEYRTVRSAQASSGSVQFRILPGTNTRCYARPAGDETKASSSLVINVHTTLSLSAYRDGVRQYHFQGTNLPRRAGQLITLYRWARRDTNGFCDPHVAAGDYTATSSDPNCVAVRTATATTNASSVWRIDRSFTGSGQFVFQVRTSANLTNAAGVSNPRLTIIH